MNWIDKGYNCYSLEIIKDVMYIKAEWSNGSYAVGCGNRRLVKTFCELTQAKLAGERFALRLIEEGAVALAVKP